MSEQPTNISADIEPFLRMANHRDERNFALHEEIKELAKEQARTNKEQAAGLNQMALSISKLTAKLGSIEEKHAISIDAIKELRVEMMQKDTVLTQQLADVSKEMHDQDKRVAMLMSVNKWLGILGTAIFTALVGGLFSQWQVSNKALDDMRIYYKAQQLEKVKK